MDPFGRLAAVWARGRVRAGAPQVGLASGSREEDAPEFVAAVEDVSRGIEDPVAKLRFLRGSLAQYPHLDLALAAVPWSPARRLLYRWLNLERLPRLLSGGRSALPVDRRTRLALLAHRTVAVATAGGVAALLVSVLLRPPRTAPARQVLAASRLPPVAEELAPLPKGVAPSAIWLVEKGGGWEQYSNGLRIETSFTVPGEPRRYRVFATVGGQRTALLERPAGILFHTSESDVWPLEAEFNDSIRESSQALLRYIGRLRLYHYVIDRFGRVFRVVVEEARANHAGHAVWASEDAVYLNLNNAFLGLCFETRWEGGRALPITQAQLAAGRSLTDYLRRRFAIPAEMCVVHGLTSVNPRRRLIGHHLDWARGFPFEAFGLPDQYARPAPSVALFGFGYDEHFLSVLGEPWAGVRAAERALAEEASRQGRSVDEIRRQRQALYDHWLSEQTRDEDAHPKARADRAPTLGAPGG